MWQRISKYQNRYRKYLKYCEQMFSRSKTLKMLPERKWGRHYWKLKKQILLNNDKKSTEIVHCIYVKSRTASDKHTCSW